MHSRARCSDPSLTRIPVPSRSRHIHPLLSRIAHTGLLLTALLLATTAGIANAVDAVDHNTTRSNRQTALADDHNTTRSNRSTAMADDHNTTRSNRSTAMADDHNTTRSNRSTAMADDHNTTRSNRSTVVGGPEPFALACELHCETGGWRIEVSESLASDNAVLGFQPQDTIYTLGADLYQPGDHYITHATAADGYFVNYPGEAPTAIVGPVYERYGPSPQPSSVYTPPIGDDGFSFCDPDPTTGAAPLTSLLDILEIEGIADTETLPLACEDHTGIEAYAKDPNAGPPGETRSAIELMIVVAILSADEVAHDTSESLTLLPGRVELDPATESSDMTPRPLDIRPDLFESSNGGHPTTKETCEAAGGVWKCDPEMKSCFCFLTIETGGGLSGGNGDTDTQLTNSEVQLGGGKNDPRDSKTRSLNNDPIPGIDIIVEKDPEDYGASSNSSDQRPNGLCEAEATGAGEKTGGLAGLLTTIKNASEGWPCKWYVPELGFANDQLNPGNGGSWGDPIPGIDIIVEKDTEDNPANGNGNGGAGDTTATAIEYGLIAALAGPQDDANGIRNDDVSIRSKEGTVKFFNNTKGFGF